MNARTHLLRQVHPVWVQQGRITSQVFRPTPKDCGKLSVYDGDMISAEKAWEHYTRRMELRSAGVVAVTEGECRDLELPVFSDPDTFPEHALIYFSALSDKEVKRKAQLLKSAALARGWLFRESEQ